MSTLIIDADRTDDLMYINEDQVLRYTSPFAMDDLYPNTTVTPNDIHISECSSEEDEDFDYRMAQPQAPPPSPQAQPMLDMIFSKKLASSLDCLINQSDDSSNNTTTETKIYSDPMEQHAQALDRLLRKTLKDDKHGSIRKHRRQSLQHVLSDCKKKYESSSSTWQARAKQQKLDHIVKATEHAEKLRIALSAHQHLIEEEVINELRDMGL